MFITKRLLLAVSLAPGLPVWPLHMTLIKKGKSVDNQSNHGEQSYVQYTVFKPNYLVIATNLTV
jgi:hypothetical protein